jgi:hypothetical protein
MPDLTFRTPRSVRNSILVFLPPILALGGLMLYGSLTDRSIPHPLRMAAFAGGFCLFWTMVGAWGLLAYWRDELTIRDGCVTSRGIIRRSRIDFLEATETRWRGSVDSGRLLLRSGSTKIAIAFGQYEPREPDWLVGYLRSAFPAEIQRDWNQFAYRSERVKARRARTKPGPDEILIRRGRYDRLVVPLVLATTAVGGFVSWFTGNPGPLVAGPILPLAWWGVLRFSVPADGRIDSRLSLRPSSEAGHHIAFLLVWGLVAGVMIFGIDAARSRLSYPDATLISASVVWFGVLMWEMVRQDRRESRRIRELADLAAKARGEVGDDPWRDA